MSMLPTWLVLIDLNELASDIPHIGGEKHNPVAEGIQRVSRHPKTCDVPGF